MSISLKTHKLLWGFSGNKCAFSDCRNDLIADETETDDESIIGDEAHIVAKSEDGPRGKSTLSVEDRDKYDNLILLCRKHHKIIDDQYKFYTVEKLNTVKKEHENWVKESLKPDKEKEKIDLAYAKYIDEIIKEIDFENWKAWTSYPIGNASIRFSTLTALERLPSFIISRFWPNKYPDLEDSLYNFKNVINDFTSVFYKYAEKDSVNLKEDEDPKNKTSFTETFYKLVYHTDHTVYDRLLDDYIYHTELIADLGLELTRAGNLLIEKIREYIYPMYREDEGKLLISYGPTEDLSYHTYKVEYNKEEKLLKHQYLGLKKFMKDREKRDLHIGKGIKQNYFPTEHE
ncbi:hypothetical protein Flavo103_31710 [Flavobacterium collinsii]|uniref:HNH endonuclease n=1 Tax=Flavobacterium collinsii TaxID=1114861 RepID=UPI0022CBF1A8|nr:HNH endonuclease signature motif containing protein [Flavobacterium collinsii]GIQ60035.1 hypothetical protein Flavo103_31710 [Flavobacterium collinsii]